MKYLPISRQPDLNRIREYYAKATSMWNDILEINNLFICIYTFPLIKYRHFILMDLYLRTHLHVYAEATFMWNDILETNNLFICIYISSYKISTFHFNGCIPTYPCPCRAVDNGWVNIATSTMQIWNNLCCFPIIYSNLGKYAGISHATTLAISSKNDKFENATKLSRVIII